LSVTLFLAGDAVLLLRNDVLDNLVGLGTGKLSEHYDLIVKSGGKFYLSGMSSKARGLTEEELTDKPYEFAMPKVLLQLSIESDRMFVY
jgi:predicted peroxiredoxin